LHNDAKNECGHFAPQIVIFFADGFGMIQNSLSCSGFGIAAFLNGENRAHKSRVTLQWPDADSLDGASVKRKRVPVAVLSWCYFVLAHASFFVA
jgi:hypothetical protein